MNIYTPYTYLIGWSKLDKWYYGSEYGHATKVANPTNLWTTYFTSSKTVKSFRELNGEPDIIEVRKIFKDEKSCRIWEAKALKRLDVIHSQKWLNKAHNAAPKPSSGCDHYLFGNYGSKHPLYKESSGHGLNRIESNIDSNYKGGKITIMCVVCDSPKQVFPRDAHQKYCSRKCMGVGRKGENNPMFGKTHTQEVRNQQTLRMMGNEYYKFKT